MGNTNQLSFQMAYRRKSDGTGLDVSSIDCRFDIDIYTPRTETFCNRGGKMAWK